jgi:hypothetical protein
MRFYHYVVTIPVACHMVIVDSNFDVHADF